VPLQTHNHRPWWDGELDLGMERERIETGWWDGQEVARDYFVATTTIGERLWIYRELKGRRGWFLHGLFG
jgi:protein ImuB